MIPEAHSYWLAMAGHGSLVSYNSGSYTRDVLLSQCWKACLSRLSDSCIIYSCDLAQQRMANLPRDCILWSVTDEWLLSSSGLRTARARYQKEKKSAKKYP